MFSTKQFILVAWAAFLVHCAGISPAQERQGRVSGSVRTERNDPIEGASVTLKGTEIGVSTNEAGEFALDVPAGGGTLVFSYLGYVAQEQPVRGGERLTVTLVSVMEDLDEVVVVGYGTMRKRDLTGAVASVQAQKLEAEAPRSVQDILRANASGLIIGQGNTAKGDATLLVRGSGTLKAGSSPLVVLDGVIFDGVLEDVNPNDIATIDILKDASATAVYGAKAANGVVLITTKRGASGKPKITLNGNLGFVENARFPRVMTAEEFLAYRYDYEMGKNSDSYHSTYPERFVDPRRLSGVSRLDWYNYDQQTPVSSVTEDQLLRAWLTRLELKTPEVDNYMNRKITDWQDLVFQQGRQQDYSAAVSNRTNDLNYYLSFNHVDREGIIVGNRFKNFRTRLNLEATIAPFLKIGTNSNFASRNEGFLQADWAQSAIVSPYASNNLDDPGSIYRRYPTGDVTPQNPFHDNFYRDRVDRSGTLNSTLYGVATFPLGIEFQSNFTPSMGWREYYDHQSSLNPEWAAKGGESERRFERTHNWQIDNVLRWRGEFAAHRFEVTLLQNAEQNQFWKTTAKTSGYTPSDVLGWHRMQAGTVPLNESDDTYNTGDALMGRLFYSLRERYMLTASVRRDGYSAFGAQNPRATFPALAFAWNFSEEAFAKPLRGWLDYGKLRLTWGENGNRDIGMYEALSDMTANPHPYIDRNGNRAALGAKGILQLRAGLCRAEQPAERRTGRVHRHHARPARGPHPAPDPRFLRRGLQPRRAAQQRGRAHADGKPRPPGAFQLEHVLYFHEEPPQDRHALRRHGGRAGRPGQRHRPERGGRCREQVVHRPGPGPHLGLRAGRRVAARRGNRSCQVRPGARRFQVRGPERGRRADGCRQGVPALENAPLPMVLAQRLQLPGLRPLVLHLLQLGADRPPQPRGEQFQFSRPGYGLRHAPLDARQPHQRPRAHRLQERGEQLCGPLLHPAGQHLADLHRAVRFSRALQNTGAAGFRIGPQRGLLRAPLGLWRPRVRRTAHAADVQPQPQFFTLKKRYAR